MAEFNIQDHLRDMEGRLREDIHEVRDGVREQSKDIDDLSMRVATVETTVRWARRILGTLSTAAAGWMGWDITVGP